MQIALIADPHVSLLDHQHCGMDLGATQRVTAALIDDVQRCQPDMVMWLGDLTHEGSEQVRRRFAELHARLTVMSVQFTGNHDVEHVDKAGFARQSAPCVRRQWWQAAGWELVVVDTVRERSPENPNGQLSEHDLRFLRDVAREVTGPLLVMGHHPMRDGYLDVDAFRRAVEPFEGTGIYIGAHTHKDRHEIDGDWHLLELAGCCCEPFGYHMLDLSPGGFAIEPITLDMDGVASDLTSAGSGSGQVVSGGALEVQTVFPLRLTV